MIRVYLYKKKTFVKSIFTVIIVVKILNDGTETYEKVHILQIFENYMSK